jgi:S-formylglutathione hydrolase FrmB
MKHGYKYFTFITEELPEIAQQFFPLSNKREDNFVAGLSMGGFGAFKIALSCPDKFAAAASLSGAVDMANRVKKDQVQDATELENIFGDLNSIENSENDLFYLAKKVLESNGPKPKLYQCCGTEDFLYEDNINFKNFIEKTGLDYTYEEGPGIHEWKYWDDQIQNVLKWLPIGK